MKLLVILFTIKIFARINNFKFAQPFKPQPHKMVKHTQTFCRSNPTSCLSAFGHFVGLTLKELILEAEFGDDS